MLSSHFPWAASWWADHRQRLRARPSDCRRCPVARTLPARRSCDSCLPDPSPEDKSIRLYLLSFLWLWEKCRQCCTVLLHCMIYSISILCFLLLLGNPYRPICMLLTLHECFSCTWCSGSADRNRNRVWLDPLIPLEGWSRVLPLMLLRKPSHWTTRNGSVGTPSTSRAARYMWLRPLIGERGNRIVCAQMFCCCFKFACDISQLLWCPLLNMHAFASNVPIAL